MSINIDLKKILHAKCLDVANEKIKVCKEVLQKINEAKTAETKSSAGDKFETSREVLQAEEDRTTSTLSNALLVHRSLSQIDPELPSSKVGTGALVLGTKLTCYICVGLGKIEHDGKVYWAISMASPLAKQMRGKTKGQKFNFNGQEHLIEDIL